MARRRVPTEREAAEYAEGAVEFCRMALDAWYPGMPADARARVKDEAITQLAAWTRTIETNAPDDPPTVAEAAAFITGYVRGLLGPCA